jgi:hypothetical protein
LATPSLVTNVLRLQIAVDQCPRVRGSEAASDLRRHFERLARLHASL